MECRRTFSFTPLRWRLLAGNEISLIELCSLFRHPCSVPSCTFVSFGVAPFLGHGVSTDNLASILAHPIVQCPSNGKCPYDFSHYWCRCSLWPVCLFSHHKRTRVSKDPHSIYLRVFVGQDVPLCCFVDRAWNHSGLALEGWSSRHQQRPGVLLATRHRS